jgi:hypothetical protein
MWPKRRCQVVSLAAVRFANVTYVRDVYKRKDDKPFSPFAGILT